MELMVRQVGFLMVCTLTLTACGPEPAGPSGTSNPTFEAVGEDPKVLRVRIPATAGTKTQLVLGYEPLGKCLTVRTLNPDGKPQGAPTVPVWTDPVTPELSNGRRGISFNNTRILQGENFHASPQTVSALIGRDLASSGLPLTCGTAKGFMIIHSPTP
ncbi:hypothetical protein LO762_26245 [Actinocorallia sp. API 0066]|uniref:hypothetical protein n=1 Tax=Actinocorallia sp. API 0066 TaxID=2896846 RepID=UPI001E3F1BC3|nr:hypothetical protein [Actinocorallia sp. API 0066]MCD0452656.1 hypothetical protein [Actinocorallia sp. API 0066]